LPVYEEFLASAECSRCGGRFAIGIDIATVCVRKYFIGTQEENARENMRMIDDANDSNRLIDEPEFNVPPPRFDESAAANAQPVEPIRARGASALYDRAASIGRAMTSGSRALVLVVIAGLATGTLVGMAWAEDRGVADVPPAANERSEVAQENPPNEEPLAEVSGVTDLQSIRPMTGQIRKGRSRLRSSGVPRAYRVAVLR
jgi:hypothetical protein